jgi:hypothetical protein
MRPIARATLILEYLDAEMGHRQDRVTLDVTHLSRTGPDCVNMLSEWEMRGKGYITESKYNYPDGHSCTMAAKGPPTEVPAPPAPEPKDPLKEIDTHLHEARLEMARAYSEWMAAMKGGLHDTPTSQRAYQAYAAIRNVVASGVSARTMILGGG